MISSTIKENIYLDDYLLNIFISKKIVYFLKIEERIIVNNKIIKNNIELHKGDYIQIDDLKEENCTTVSYNHKIEIVYEDDYLLIVNKPTGFLIYSDTSNNCIDDMIANYYKQTKQNHKVYHLHRLDIDTSGLLIYIKQPYWLARFDNMLASKEIKREYQALVVGSISKKMTIDKPIGSDRHQNNKYCISKNGKNAITVVTPIKQIGSNTLVNCQLLTGRTHQIRVHLSSINHPIVGDKIYGGLPANRLMLHSYSVSFTHPVTNKIINITKQANF